ncbi:hypothetical protein [Halosimplex pelagicum]|uniref:Uncharacterized protein n=1 Tax=Halosimplex pelagicum TaxID=869886 RepID=A0A7D5P9E5_9EURY|nr:hypothetical protein [Halosimplex pelagicum]QLH84023.1 hypothetical protein HZS54_21325 [Halosimplex pelagicum]
MSAWPLLIAAGPAGVYAAAGLAILGDAVPGWSAPAAAVVGSALFCVGVTGWRSRFEAFGGSDASAERATRLGLAALACAALAAGGAGFAVLVHVLVWP